MLKILFLVVVLFLVFNIVRFMLFLGRSSNEARKRMEDPKSRQGSSKNSRNGSGKNKIIELDKDQYHVD